MKRNAGKYNGMLIDYDIVHHKWYAKQQSENQIMSIVHKKFDISILCNLFPSTQMEFICDNM